MPTLRSATDRSAEAGFIFRSELPASSIMAMLPFMRGAFRIRKSLEDLIAAEPGALLHYALVADLGGKRLTVDSSWADEATFRRWVGSEPHRNVMSSLRSRVSGPATFETEVRTESP